VAERKLSAAAEAAKTASIAEIDRDVAVAREARAAAVAERRSTLAQTASIVQVDTDAIIADRKRELEIRLRDRQIAGLSAARDRLEKGTSLASFNTALQASLDKTKRLETSSASERRA